MIQRCTNESTKNSLTVASPPEGQRLRIVEQLPQVMADRYVMMTALALAAAWFGHPGVIAVLFASFAYMGFHDAVIYARAGHPVTKHVAAGIAAGAVSGLAAFAQFRGGAA